MNSNNMLTPNDDKDIQKLIDNSIELIEYARLNVARQINIIQIMTYYALGKWIVDYQQHGQARAQYGKSIIKLLSASLTEKYGKGFSKTNLEYARKFYLVYENRISQTVFEQFAVQKNQTVFGQLQKAAPFTLPWSHYLQLMRIEDENERSFYEIEATKSNWSIRTLQRQYNSSLYERLALSRDKNEVMKLAQKGIVVSTPQDIVKQPMVLEFLGLEEKPSYSESDLESALIQNCNNKLHTFAPHHTCGVMS